MSRTPKKPTSPKGQALVSTAVLSFCPDLTDPDAASVPVALIGFATAPDNETGVLFLAVRESTEIAKDEITRDVFARLTSFLRDEIDRGVEEVGVQGLLGWLQYNLRNSLYISKIVERAAPIEREPPSLWQHFYGQSTRELPVESALAPWMPETVFGPLVRGRGERGAAHA